MNWFREKIERFINSFDTKNDGFSGRKLSALFAILISGYSTIHFCTADILSEILIIWLTFAAFCLGLVSATQIITLKNGSSKITETNKID